MNTETSSCSCGNSGIILPFFAVNVSLRSITWSQGLQVGMHSDSCFWNTCRNLYRDHRTSSAADFLEGGIGDVSNATQTS